MSSEEEYSECATPDIMNYDQKKLVNDKYGSISLCKLFNSKNYFLKISEETPSYLNGNFNLYLKSPFFKRHFILLSIVLNV